MHVGPAAPNCPKGSGVGVLARKPTTVIPWRSKNGAYRAVYDQGRGANYEIELGGITHSFGVVYGAIGGASNETAAQKMDRLFGCIRET